MKKFLVTTRPQEKFSPVHTSTCFEIRNIPITRVVPRKDFNWATVLSYNPEVYVVTSAVGAELLVQGIQEDALYGKTFIAIGNSTADVLSRSGIVSEIPESHDSSGIADLIIQKYSRSRIALIRSSMGSPELTSALDEHRISYRDFQIYDILRRTADLTPLSDENMVGILLTSRYEASIILDYVERNGIHLSNIFAIGHTTRKFIENKGYCLSADTPNSDFEEAIRIIAEKICT